MSSALVAKQHVANDGARIHYWSLPGRPGQPSVLLLHGLNGNHSAYRPFVKPLQEAGYRVVIPDLRAHGESLALSAADELSMARLCEDIEGICQQEDLRELTVLAHCFGALPGLLMAQRQVIRVRQLMLLAPLWFPSRSPDRWSFRRLLGEPYIALLTGLPFRLPDPRRHFHPADHSHHQHWPLWRFWLSDWLTNPLWLTQMGLKSALASREELSQALDDFPPIPVSLLSGGHDMMVPPSHVQALAERISVQTHVTHEIIPKVGHVMPVQQPGAVITRLLALLRS